MENTENLLPEYSEKPKFSHSAATEQEWLKTGSWAKFFGIYGMAYFGVSLLGIIFMLFSIWPALTSPMFQLPPMMAWGFGILFVMAILGVICVFLGSRHHLRFAQQIKVAVHKRDPTELANAWRSMKSVWKAYGIYTLIVVAFYLIALATIGYML